MAEIEFSVLFGQALNKRIPNQESLKREIKAWQDNRNANTKTTNWKFTTKDARIKLKKLYPTIVDVYFTLFFHPFHSKPSTFLSLKQACEIVA